jgi:hypothetical protein
VKIYYTGVDTGDGSISVEFFNCQKCIHLLEDYFPEHYRGEGGGSFEVGYFNGVRIQTLQDVEKLIKERFDDENHY